jgi:sec-independent protein translocase protein TatA
MFNALEPWHLLIIVGVVVVLFGAKRLPSSARSLGQSMRVFRTEMAQAKQDPTADAALSATPPMPPAVAPAPVPAAHTTQIAGDRA